MFHLKHARGLSAACKPATWEGSRDLRVAAHSSIPYEKENF